MFLGDSGIAILSYIIAVNFISQYNEGIILDADLIFLYFSIPGFELIRLTFFRIIIGKHPFSADNNHLHHYLNKIFSPFKTLILIIGIYLLPIILNIFGLNLVYCILTSLILYSISVGVSYKKLSNNKNDLLKKNLEDRVIGIVSCIGKEGLWIWILCGSSSH